MLFTDIDSLTYEIKSEDVYNEIFKHKHLFDFSNYPKDSTFFYQANKKVIGKMKVESEGKIIDEFVGLKSKMYTMKNSDGKKSKMAKGVRLRLRLMNSKKIYLTKKYSDIKWEEVKAKNIKGIIRNQQNIITFFDDKKFVLNNGFHTLAYIQRDTDSHKW